MWILHHDVAVRKQDRVKVETLEAAKVCRGDLTTVTGDADKPHQPLLARLDASFECALRAQRSVPFDRVGETVELDEIHAVDAHAFEGTMNLYLGFFVRAATCLRCEKKAAGILLEPRGNPQL